MKHAKVRNRTVGFFRRDAEAPFINLEMFKTIEEATGIPHYWRDENGKVSQFWHSGVIPKGTGVMCKHRQRGMKHTFWVVTDPESDLVGKMFIIGHLFRDRIEDSEEMTDKYRNASPMLKHSILAEKPLTR